MFPIIEKLGGWDSVRKILAARGMSVSDAAYRQWRSRNRRALPEAVKLTLEIEAMRRGIRYAPADFRFRKKK